jgi:hypothetical protein
MTRVPLRFFRHLALQRIGPELSRYEKSGRGGGAIQEQTGFRKIP